MKMKGRSWIFEYALLLSIIGKMKCDEYFAKQQFFDQTYVYAIKQRATWSTARQQCVDRGYTSLIPGASIGETLVYMRHKLLAQGWPPEEDIWVGNIKHNSLTPWLTSQNCLDTKLTGTNDTCTEPQCLVLPMASDDDDVGWYGESCSETHYYACQHTTGIDYFSFSQFDNVSYMYNSFPKFSKVSGFSANECYLMMRTNVYSALSAYFYPDKMCYVLWDYPKYHPASVNIQTASETYNVVFISLDETPVTIVTGYSAHQLVDNFPCTPATATTETSSSTDVPSTTTTTTPDEPSTTTTATPDEPSTTSTTTTDEPSTTSTTTTDEPSTTFIVTTDEPSTTSTSKTLSSSTGKSTRSSTSSSPQHITSMSCPCNCAPTLTEEDIATMKQDLKKEHTLDKKKLNSHQRKQNCQPDSRQSSKAIGAVGVVVLTTAIAFPLLGDALNVLLLIK